MWHSSAPVEGHGVRGGELPPVFQMVMFTLPAQCIRFSRYCFQATTIVFQPGVGTILLMDDEELIIDTTTSILKSFVYSVVGTENGNEAIDCFRNGHDNGRTIVALILDLTVPGNLGGKETVKRIRNIDGKIPVFVASGYADDPVVANPSEYGFAASICKPLKKSELATMLNQYLK